MAIIVEAVYENGVLKLSEPLPLKEHEKVEVIVRSKASAETVGVVPCQDAALIEWAAMSPDLEYPSTEEAAEPDGVARAYGLLGWTGDSETVQRIALDSEYGLPEEP